MVDDQDRIHVSLVMCKSRVTPSKPLIIPRLELTVVLVSAKVSDFLQRESTKVIDFLQRELDYSDVTPFYWTDSKVVLGYGSNNVRCFHVFAVNRVQQIRDLLSSPAQWRYVDTKVNPADLDSRGLHAEELINMAEWSPVPLGSIRRTTRCR